MIHPSAWKRFSGTLSQLIKCLPTKGGFTRAYLYAPPQHVVPSHAAWRTSEGILWPLEGRFMHDHESELRRIPLPRTWVNRGKKKGRGCYYAPVLLAVPSLECPLTR